MRNMGNSGKTAIGAGFAALALLVLTGITLHETVFMWFLAACTLAYVACAAELLIRQRHKTLAASGFGSILFIAFGIAFLRQWGLAFNPDPDALSAPVNSRHPDLYFYLAALSGAVTLLLLFTGCVLPARSPKQRSRNTAPRRPASRPAARYPAGAGAPRPGTSRGAVSRASVSRASGPPARKSSPARPPAPKPPVSTAKRPDAGKPPAPKRAAKPPTKPPVKASVRPAAPPARR